MALKDDIALGMVLPHRSQDPLDRNEIRHVAQRAEALGFRDLWVTENTLDECFSVDAMVVLSHAAAVTSKIGVAVAVVVLPVHSPIHIAHQIASIDFLSNGRAILGVGIGREEDYHDFQIPLERRVRRFREGIEVMKALWTQDSVRYDGDFYKLDTSGIALKPVQKPHPPLWLGGGHPNAIKRSVKLGDGWIGAGGQSATGFAAAISMLKQELDKAGRDPAKFALSKRVFMMVDENPEVARRELNRWCTEVYHRPELMDNGAVWGTPAQVRDKLEELRRAGADHLLLNPVTRYSEQLEALAEVTGLQ